jgi:hypothetical protein
MVLFLSNQENDSESFRQSLSNFQKWIRDRHIPRQALIDLQASAWEHLYSARNDHQSLITLTGLALCLAYYCFQGSNYILQGWFGFTGTPLALWTIFALILVIHILKDDNSKVQWPNEERMLQYKQLIHNKHPILQYVFCVDEGL